MQPTFDPTIVALMHGIKMKEGGGKIDYNIVGDKGTAAGAGQWSNQVNGKVVPLQQGQVPINFQNQAKQYGLNPTDFSPENQNKVLYADINAKKQKGLSPEQILSVHNSGDPNKYLTAAAKGTGQVGNYDVATYVKDAMSYAQQYAARNNTSEQGNGLVNSAYASDGNSSTQSNPSGSWFPSSPTDTPTQAGFKTAGNLIPSAINFVKGAFDMINPLSTIEKLSQIPAAYQEAVSANQGNVGQTLKSAAGAAPGEVTKALIPEAGRQLLTGDFAGAQASITNDPVGSIAPFLLAGDQVAKFADTNLGGNTKAAQNIVDNGGTFNMGKGGVATNTGTYQGMFDNGISKTASLGKVITAPVEGMANLGVAIAKGAASHVLGLDPQTMGTIINNREAFSKLSQDQISRGSLADEFGKSIDSLDKTLQETGAGYAPIRNMTGKVGVPENFLKSVMQDKFGLVLDENGKIIADTNSVTRNKADIAAIQNFVDNWGDKTTLTPGEFLNMRGDLADIAKYDSAKSTKAGTIADQLRQEANRSMRPQIPGLQALDQEFAPRVEQFKQIKKDFLTKDPEGGYTFKDGATNKIANASGVGKDNLLARMEEIHPGITQKIQILKAVEDIQKSYGLKVGNYTRGIIEGGAVLSGNIPLAIMTAILTSPAISVPLLRGLGYTVAKVKPIIGVMQMMAGDVKIPSIIPTKTNPEVPR